MQRYQKDLLLDNKNFAIQYLERGAEQAAMAEGHCHVHYEIYVQTAGRRCYFLKNTVYEIETGDVVLIAPGLMHKTSNIDKMPYSRLLIEFDVSFLQSLNVLLGAFDFEQALLSLLSEGYYIFRSAAKKDNVLEKCNAMTRLFSSENPVQASRANLLVGSLLLDLIGEPSEINVSLDVGSRYKISEILHYINLHYYEDISLKSVSELFYLSYYYLSRLFKEVTGFTFVAYVNIIRVNKARVLISDTDDTLETIAEQVGFGSQKQFVRTFKSLYGTSPSKFRSALKQTKKPYYSDERSAQPVCATTL